jgi:hypothetical protein
MRKLAAALLLLLAPVLASAQTAIRPDQISPVTPDITWLPGGTGYQIGSTIPWRQDTTATPAICTAAGVPAGCAASDNTKVVELTFAGAISLTLPAATGSFVDGAGFTIQVGSGTLTLSCAASCTAGANSPNSINGLTFLKVGPYQSVALLSKGGKWYANLSVPPPLTQTGTTVLGDQMTWAPGGTVTPGAITLDGHGVGTAAAVNTATVNSAPITVTAIGEVFTVFWLYCKAGDTSCNSNSGSVVNASAVSGSLAGTTCTLLPAAAGFMVNATQTSGVGAALCYGNTVAGTNTITVTMVSVVNYLQVWVASWTGAATTVDTACTGVAQNTVQTLGTAIPTASNTTIANDVLVGIQFVGTTTTISGTNSTLLIDGATNAANTTMYKKATTTGPYSLTTTLGATSIWNGNVICIHP